MNHKLILRTMKEIDLDGVKACQERNLQERYPDVMWKNIVQSYTENSLVLESEREICGILIASKHHIISFAIDEDIRKKGWGTLMMDKFLHNKTEVYLQVRKSNKSAINLYQKFGFKLTYVLKNYYKNEDGLYMKYKK